MDLSDTYEQRRIDASARTRKHMFTAMWIALRLFVVTFACGVGAPVAYAHSLTAGRTLAIAACFLAVPTVVAGIYTAWFFYEWDDGR